MFNYRNKTLGYVVIAAAVVMAIVVVALTPYVLYSIWAFVLQLVSVFVISFVFVVGRELTGAYDF